jgi:hypothetical protein
MGERISAAQDQKLFIKQPWGLFPDLGRKRIFFLILMLRQLPGRVLWHTIYVS